MEQPQSTTKGTSPLTPAKSRLLDFAVEIRDADYEPERAFISREMVQATLPHRNPGDIPVWSRLNGNYVLTVAQQGITLASVSQMLVTEVSRLRLLPVYGVDPRWR